MFIPLRTNRAPRRRPIVTEALLVANLLVYLAGLVAERAGAGDRRTIIELGHLVGSDFHVWQLVTYQFLHDPYGIAHIAFNMLFLWVFGCAVEGRLGRISFLGFYLIGGAVAGVAHMMVEPGAPVIGASGAIAAVSGAFLALFPRARVQVLVFFFFIGIYSIPALWFIGLFFFLDVLRATGQLFGAADSGVAFMAHLAGYLYGFSFAVLLLATGILKREEFDIFYLFKQSKRRAGFRRMARQHVGGTWDSASADTSKQLAERENRPAAPSREALAQGAERTEINRLVDDHQLVEAAARYRALLGTAPETTLPEDRQLDVANQLSADGADDAAARAYELFLRAYPRGGKAAEVRLLLGVLYARRLGQPGRARDLIEQARALLVDGQQRALADQLLAEIG